MARRLNSEGPATEPLAQARPTSGKKPRRRVTTSGKIIQRQEDIGKAIELRRQGKTFSQIAEVLNRGKGTICTWIAERISELNANANEAVEKLIEHEWGVTSVQLVSLLELFHAKTTALEDKIKLNREICRVLDRRAKYRGLDAQDVLKMQPPVQQNNTQINLTLPSVNIEESNDWYGNAAHDLAAARIASSDSRLTLAGPIQGSGVRPTLGQNGNGTNGHH